MNLSGDVNKNTRNVNQTDCKDVEEVNKKMESQIIFFNLLLPYVSYKSQNYNDALTTKLKTNYHIINTKQFLLDEIYFSKIELEDDRTTVFFLPDTEEIKTLGGI